jgi:putative ABC transport system permease protein
MHDLGGDVRLAFRRLRHRPGYAAVVTLVLALAIGAGTAVYGMVDTVLLRTLPFAHFERLVLLWGQDLPSGRDRITLSPREYLEYRRGARSFAAMGAVRAVGLNAQVEGAAIAVEAVQATPSLFATLGLRPALGRAFSAREASEGARVALLSHELWTSAFGADPGVLGRTLSLQAGFTGPPAEGAGTDGRYSIVGVLPPGVRLPYREAELWLPLPLDAAELAEPGGGLVVLARLRDGVSIAAAQADAAAVARRLAVELPERNRGVDAWLVTLRAEDVGDITPTLVLLAASVLLLSLVLCANLANMLSSRLLDRRREIAVRSALGAGRGRLVRQLLAESVLLGGGGALLGIAVAYGLVRLLVLLAPPTIPRVAEVRLDVAALGVALLAALLMTLFFAVAPAWGGSRERPAELSVRSGNAPAGGRPRKLLVAAEVALGCLVLVGVALVVRSALALERAPLGYQPAGVLTFRVNLPRAAYAEAERREAFNRELLAALRALPDVTAAGAVSILPQEDTNSSVELAIEGAAPPAAEAPPSARFRVATPGYFAALGIPILHGRELADGDLANGALVVSRSFAAQHWPRGEAVGRRLRLRLPGRDLDWLPVVGVVEDVRQWIDTPAEPTVYLGNLRQPMFSFALRSHHDPATLAAAVRAAVARVDARQPILDLRTADERLRRSQQLTYERFRTTLMATFGGAALLLVALGIYGVVRHTVAQRIPELAIRLALGAHPRQVGRLVLFEVGGWVAAGAALGLAASWLVARRVAGLLYGAAGSEPVALAAAAAAVAVVTRLAVAGPARQARRADPLTALRGG